MYWNFSPGHPYRANALGHLAASLHYRFEQRGTLYDLDEALALERNALELRLEGHPDRTRSLRNLAAYHHDRFKHSIVHDISDLQETFELYSQLAHLSQTVCLVDVTCCKSWIQAAEECGHSTTVLSYRTFLGLTTHHLTTVPSLSQHLVLLKHLMASTPVDAFSPCVYYGKDADAIELLEQGRDVFWGHLFRLRSPLDEVIASGSTGKQLTEQFAQLASLLRTVLNGPPNAESQHDRAFSLNIRLQDIVTEIRKYLASLVSSYPHSSQISTSQPPMDR